MARPEKHTVDYFPFYCKEGPAMYYIENKYQNNGFAVWVKILRQLAVTDRHYLNLSDGKTLMFMTAKCRVEESLLINIIEDLIRFEEFDKPMWDEARILTGEKFLSSIADAYKKRNTPPPTLLGLRSHLCGLGLLKPTGNEVSDDDKTHTILYNTIQYDSIENYIKKAEKKLEEMRGDQGWMEVSCMQLKTSPELFSAEMPRFLKTIAPTDLNQSEGQIKRYYYNWLRKELTTKNNGNGTGTKQNADVKRNELNDLKIASSQILNNPSGDGKH